MNKWKKAGFAVALIVIVAVSAGLVRLTMANIRYWFNVDYAYQADGDQWVTVDRINDKQMSGTFITVECRNNGYLDGSFNLIVTFTNATLATTNEPCQQINSTTAKLPHQLGANETRSTDVYFTIDEGAERFLISLWFESSQVLIRSSEGNWLGINTLYYEYDEEGNEFLARLVQ